MKLFTRSRTAAALALIAVSAVVATPAGAAPRHNLAGITIIGPGPLHTAPVAGITIIGPGPLRTAPVAGITIIGPGPLTTTQSVG